MEEAVVVASMVVEVEAAAFTAAEVIPAAVADIVVVASLGRGGVTAVVDTAATALPAVAIAADIPGAHIADLPHPGADLTAAQDIAAPTGLRE